MKASIDMTSHKDCSILVYRHRFTNKDGSGVVNAEFKVEGLCYLCLSTIKLIYLTPTKEEALSMRFLCRYIHRHIQSYDEPEKIVSVIEKENDEKHISDNEIALLAAECKRFNFYLQSRRERDVNDGILDPDGDEDTNINHYDRAYEDDAVAEYDVVKDVEMKDADSGIEEADGATQEITTSIKQMKVKVLNELHGFLRPLTKTLFTTLFNLIANNLAI